MEVSQDILVGYLQDYKPQHNEKGCIHHSYSSDYEEMARGLEQEKKKRNRRH